MAIHIDKSEIPIPKGAHINHHDGRVFVYTTLGAVRRNSQQKIIGRAVSDTHMVPNDNFRELFPRLWEEHYGEDVIQSKTLGSGLFGLMLGAGYSTMAYPCLLVSIGPEESNAVMDFATHILGSEYNAIPNQVTFSNVPPGRRQFPRNPGAAPPRE